MSEIDRRRFLGALGRTGLLAATAPSLLAACRSALTPAASGPATSTGEPESKTLRIGYLPITDATPLLLAHGRGLFAAEGLDVERPTLFRSWAQLAEAFQARQVDVVHILMPMAVWMRFGQNVPIKLVAWNHLDGSALTVGNEYSQTDDLAGQTVAIPFWYSIHNVVLQMILNKAGLKPITTGDPSRANRTVKLVVMGPPDMPPALANKSIAGYIVADPFNAVAEVNKVGRIHRFTGDVWLNHACCVVIMHEDDTVKRPRWAQSVVNAVAKAQIFARENRAESAKILSKDGGDYLPQPLPVIERALTHYDRTEYTASGAIKHGDWTNNRIDFQPFPFPSYTEELVKLLKTTVVEGDATFLQTLDPKLAHQQLVDDRFAREVLRGPADLAKFGLTAGLTRTERIEV